MQATIHEPANQVGPREIERQIEQQARTVVDAHSHFYGRADRFEFHCRDEVLIVRGIVPSFYLKQLLQVALQSLQGVDRIENQVAVVSSEGLSSIERNGGE